MNSDNILLVTENSFFPSVLPSGQSDSHPTAALIYSG
ncbi:hypothetical protein LSH36_737g04015 [Paralvinella palmiformis]|uniref:Uncharacterized protein n=1 Tax=Paralvinella palmiformis TaxID=53620 RepID=A0AAD9J173_9ANNE|nr:hypothetical protein LSH36_737g04015 [Paralvinella palmiformis]